MRPHAFIACATLFVSAAATVVIAQPRRPNPRRPTADAAASADAAGDVTADTPAGDAGPQMATPLDAGRADAARMDAGRTATGDVPAGDAPVGDASASDAAIAPTDARYPMHQVGTGTVIHFPVPEQLVRTAVPVFAQIRSSAPIDHVSLFFRSVGARRYTEVRMTAMGQQFHLPSGYGAEIPCEDVFPPRVEYYVQAIDQSNTSNGGAGTDAQPLQIPVVETRTYPAPTLPGQPPPRTCGSLTVAPTVRDAGAASAVPERGTNDLGEPCRIDNDCRRGLRCSSGHTCIFETTH